MRADRRDARVRLDDASSRGPSRDHTERILRRARVPFERDGGRITVAQVDELELDEVVVPGDPSSAAFIVAAAILVSGSRVVVKDVGLNWTRTGFFRIAERMGAVIVGELEEPGTESDEEPVGELDVASGLARGRRSSSPTRCRSRSTSSRWSRCSARTRRGRRSCAARRSCG